LKTVSPEDMDLTNFTDEGEQEKIVEFLTSGRIVLAAHGKIPDHYEEEAPAVPVAYYTDGTWVWGWEITEYIRRYSYGLPSEFLAWIRQCEYVPNDCSEETTTLAYKFLTGQI